MPLKPATGKTRFPPAIELDDAGVRWARTEDGLVVTREPTVRGVIGAFLVLAGAVALLIALLVQQAWAYAGIVALAALAALPVVLLRLVTRFTLRVTPDGVTWHAPRPFDRWGAWKRTHLHAVRFREGTGPRVGFRRPVTVQVRVTDKGWVDVASTYRPERARALADALRDVLRLPEESPRAQNDAA